MLEQNRGCVVEKLVEFINEIRELASAAERVKLPIQASSYIEVAAGSYRKA